MTPDGKILLFATVYAKQVVTHVFYSEIDPQSGLSEGERHADLPDGRDRL